MEHPLFSIITITYNAAMELPVTMKSVADQRCHDFEHIIVDGASKDDTLALARSLGVDGLRIVSERDSGLYDAMNKGIHFAKGKYLIFLNAGDSFASADTLGQYAKAASSSPDIIYGDTVIVDAGGNILRPRHLSVPQVLSFESFSDGMLVCHQAFCVRRNLAPDYDLKYRFSADYDWTVRCLKASSPEKCINLNSVTIHYLDNGMTEKNKRNSLLERFEIMCRHYGVMRAVGKHLSFIPRAVSRRIKSRSAENRKY